MLLHKPMELLMGFDLNFLAKLAALKNSKSGLYVVSRVRR